MPSVTLKDFWKQLKQAFLEGYAEGFDLDFFKLRTKKPTQPVQLSQSEQKSIAKVRMHPEMLKKDLESFDQFKNIFEDLSEFYSKTSLEISENMPWEMITDFEEFFRYQFLCEKMYSTKFGDIYPIMECQPRDEVLVYYNHNIHFIDYEYCLEPIEKYCLDDQKIKTIEEIWDGFILPEIIRWDTDLKKEMYFGQENWTTLNPNGSFEMPLILDFQKVLNSVEIWSYFESKFDFQKNNYSSNEVDINQQFECFEGLLKIIHITKKEEIICIYKNLIICFVPQIDTKLYLFFQDPKQVWQELIKPDIEEYYGTVIDNK